MPSACNLHPKSGYSYSSHILRRKVGFALPFGVFGAIAAASSVVVQMADVTPTTPTTDGRSSIVAFHSSDPPADIIVPPAFPAESELPRGPGTMPAAHIVSLAPPAESTPPLEPGASLATSTVLPEPNADDAPDSRQDSTTQLGPAQGTPDLAPTKPSRPSVASKKSRKSAQAQTRRRDRGWYNAYAWRQQPAYYWRGSGYGRSYWRTSWRW